MARITKASLSEIVNQYLNIINNVRIYDVTKSDTPYWFKSVNFDTNDKIPYLVTIDTLQKCINFAENSFSGNCNCLVNSDCCQTCQAECSSAVSSCQSCQFQSCQSIACQTQDCQTSVCQTYSTTEKRCQSCESGPSCQEQSCQKCQDCQVFSCQLISCEGCQTCETCQTCQKCEECQACQACQGCQIQSCQTCQK